MRDVPSYRRYRQHAHFLCIIASFIPLSCCSAFIVTHSIPCVNNNRRNHSILFFSSLRQVATWRIYLTNPLFCGILYTYSNHHVILWVTCTPLVLLHNVFTPGRNAQCIQSRNHRAFPDNFIKSPYLSRIEDLPPKQTAGGSNPPGDAISCQNRMILALFCAFYHKFAISDVFINSSDF